MSLRRLSVLALLTLAGTASADPAGAPSADALFQAAKEALARGDVATACAQFAESERLDHAAGTVLNLADCEERQGKRSSALVHFRDGRDRLPPGDFRVRFADERIEKLSAVVPFVTFSVRGGAPEGMTFAYDGVVLGPASLGVSLPMDPGRHDVVVRAPGHADAVVPVTLTEGTRQDVELTIGPRVAQAANAPASAAREGSDGDALGTVGWVVGGVGVAAVATGAVLGLLTKLHYDSATGACTVVPTNCPPSAVAEASAAHGQATASTVVFIAGGALAATGLTLLLVAPRKREGARIEARVAGPGLVLGGAW